MPRRNVLWILSVVLIFLLRWQGATGAGGDDDDYEFYRLLVDALNHIERSYVEKVDRKELLEGAIQGMLTNLDPYSSYINKESFQQFQKHTEGHFGGIGIQIGRETRNSPLTVISPLVGTPAYKAGIHAGDKIVEIEGQSTENTTVDQAANKIMGAPDTEVTLTILQEGKTEPRTITLTRKEIQIESVLGDNRKPDDRWDWVLDKKSKIAYVRINSFISSTRSDLDKAISQAKEDGMVGLVLDLRFNPGGLLQSAIEVSDMFLRSGAIVSTEGRNTRPREWKATGDGSHTDFPLAILVNHYSASASEIVAAALQDNGRAKIVGDRTWGKGSVQNVIELEGGKSALKLTTAEYHRPNGHNIHRREKAKETDEWGVMPDDGLEVKFSPEETVQYVRWRRERDILRNKPAEPKNNGESKPEEKGPDAAKPFVDKQLQKALEYVQSQLTSKVATRK